MYERVFKRTMIEACVVHQFWRTLLKMKIIAAALFAGGIVVGIATSQVIHAQGPSYATRQILQTDLNNLPGQEVLLFASTWPPGFRLPLHMHPDGHEFTFVIEGEQSFEIDGV